jgi:DNA-directed RNA polymerase specialized sigma24 family protein
MKCEDEAILLELIGQSQRYCMHIYWKERKTFWAVPKERALEIAEEQALYCRNRCLREEVECFKRCLIAHFKWRMLDSLKEQIDEQNLVYADSLKSEISIDESDDEVLSRQALKARAEMSQGGQEESERWHDIEKHLQGLQKFEAEVFVLSFQYSPDQIADITGRPKHQVIAAKHRAKKKLKEALSSEEE